MSWNVRRGKGVSTRLMLSAAIGVLSAAPLFAQAGVGVIEGTVKEAGSGRPIEGVTVSIGAFRAADRLVPAVGALTNRDGN